LKNRNWILVASLWLNAILLLAIAAGYLYLRFEQMQWELEGPHWATYAGTMQCIADHGAGNRRLYRLQIVTSDKGERQFTGDRENGIDIWSWPWYPNLGEASRASNQEFVDAYNRRMKNFIAEAATRPAG
jgi:hypothetical protein